VQTGDIIHIDIPNRSINVALTENELDARRAAENAKGALAWKPTEARPRKVSASLKAYAMLATSADKGAVRDLSKLD
jgi:dihydroxy-acid dehydratase